MSKLDRLERYRRCYQALRPGWVPATAQYQHWVQERLCGTYRVLDLGCGRGGIAERLSNRGSWIGVDPDLLSLHEHRLPALSRACARSEHLPFEDATFDVVVASWLLEHLPAPEMTFDEIGRVLRPGGAFFFLTPHLHHPLPRLSAAFARARRVQERVVTLVYGRAPADTFPVYYRANTLRAIESLAVAAHLRLQHIAYVGDPSYFAWHPVMFALAAGIDAWSSPAWKIHLIGHFERVA